MKLLLDIRPKCGQGGRRFKISKILRFELHPLPPNSLRTSFQWCLTHELKLFRGMEHSLFFVEHSNPDSISTESKSRTNLFEAGYALKVASYLVQRGYDSKDITVLTLYVGQMLAIKRVRT